jgi:hypothetical protein
MQHVKKAGKRARYGIKKLRRKTPGREEGGRPGRVTRKPNIVGPCPHRFRAQKHGVRP